MKSYLAGLAAFVLTLSATVYAQARIPFTKVNGATVTPLAVNASGTGDQFVCTATTAVCEVESSITAATMTSTVPAFDIGPTATPDANDRLACFSYGASGSKTRVACVDTEGDFTASGGLTGVSCNATATSGASFTGGNSSNSLLISSATPDSITTTTVAAIRLQAAQDIASNDLIFSVQDSAGNVRFGVREDSIISTGVHSASNVQADGALVANGRFQRVEDSVTIPDSGGAGAAAYTWTPAASRSVFYFTCNDADGCDITVSETSALNSRIFRAFNVATNTITFTDTAGVTEMAGNFTMGQWDNIEFHYVTDRFVEIGRVNN